MSPFLSGSGTSNQRTRMLLEVVAKADTLVGPLEGTGKNKEIRGLDSLLFAIYSKICHISCVWGQLLCTYGSKIEKDLFFCVCVCTQKLVLFWLGEKSPSRIGLFSSLALILGQYAWFLRICWSMGKKSTGIPHLSPCVLNFLRLHS